MYLGKPGSVEHQKLPRELPNCPLASEWQQTPAQTPKYVLTIQFMICAQQNTKAYLRITSRNQQLELPSIFDPFRQKCGVYIVRIVKRWPQWKNCLCN